MKCSIYEVQRLPHNVTTTEFGCLFLFAIDNLLSHRLHSDAAIVLLQYSNNVEAAITTLIEGCEWEEAIRLVNDSKKTELDIKHVVAYSSDAVYSSSWIISNLFCLCRGT